MSLYDLFKLLIGNRKRKTVRRRRGDWGEKKAADYLRVQKNYRVLCRNWENPQNRREEIDLVCRKGEVTVFVEVRTRRRGSLIGGYASIGPGKRKSLRRAGRSYLHLCRNRPQHVQWDVVEVEYDPDAGLIDIHHYENIPLFSG